MSGFLRFTLFVAALCAAAVVGYVAGVRNAGPSPPSDERMTIDTHGTSGSKTAEPKTPSVSPAPESKAAEAAAEDAVAQNADDNAAPPTSIDEILRRQSSQPQPAD